MDPEKIDLNFEVPWSSRRLSEFGGFFSGLSGKSSMYLTRMVVSKEAGLEFHYKETLNGLDEVVHLELGQVSAVHHWTKRIRNEDGPDTTLDFFAIIADSVVHKLPKLEEPQPWEPDWDADVPEKIRKLCDILELSLNKTKPWQPDFLERSKKENTGAKRPTGKNGEAKTAQQNQKNQKGAKSQTRPTTGKQNVLRAVALA